MNKRDAYEAGARWGHDLGTYTDFDPARDFDPEEHATMADAFERYCWDAEGHARQYSPFEFTAHAINTSRDPEAYWEAFERGTGVGIRKAWRNRKATFGQ